MRVLILDLKWSYGIEAITSIFREQLGRHHSVRVISATESQLPSSIKLAPSRSHRDMVLNSLRPSVYLRLYRELRRFQPDIVYLISPHIMNVPVCLLMRVLGGICIISHIHDPSTSDGFLAATTKNLTARLQSFLSHRVYCWGHSIKRTIVDNFHVSAAKVAVFRHGPGQRTPADNLAFDCAKQSPRYFSLIGTIHDRKGIAHFIQAARLFNQRHGLDAVQFLLAGAGDLSKYGAAIAQVPNLILQNRFLKDEEINDFLAHSYASVLPYTEGMMQSSFIAIAYGNGCPVIVSNLGSLPEEVEIGKTGYVVEKANPEQIADSMTRIYLAAEGQSLMQNDCLRAYREKFTWDSIGEQLRRDMLQASRKFQERGQQKSVCSTRIPPTV